MAPGAVDIRARLAELKRLGGGPTVSVYLNTRWADEHQRERVRVFLKTELRRAREQAGPALADDLGWIAEQGEALVSQTRLPDAHGVALFASRALGLREVIPLGVQFEDAFVVADRPHLGPLAAMLAAVPQALLVFVDGASARLIPLGVEGAGEEVRLAQDVPGRHRRGDWAQLAQSRYQRHIAEHRDRHFEAVAEAVAAVEVDRGLEHIVLAGEVRAVAALRRHLPPGLSARVVGTVAGADHEPPAVLARRAAELLSHHEAEAPAVDVVLTEAAKGGRATAGVPSTVSAVIRGAVQRLYLLKAFRQAGRECPACGVLEVGDGPRCGACGGPTRPVELATALAERVVATGGSVQVVETNAELARSGGVAARLRYPASAGAA
jgi:hypothetical protein